VEFEALASVFGRRIPPVTANKSLIGHAMGASSAIETVMAIQGMEQGLVPPTLNHQPDPAMDFDLVTGTARRLDQGFVLKNAFGFGGCNACVVLRNPGEGKG
jgi:3-oxoacyl-[acyl-carrier-protein] synthase II